MKRKLSLILPLLLLVLLFAACQSEVYLSSFERVDDGRLCDVTQLHMRLNHVEEQILNSSAKTPESTKHKKHNFEIDIQNRWKEGDPWQVQHYIRVLAHYATDYKHIETEAEITGYDKRPTGFTMMTFEKSVPKESIAETVGGSEAETESPVKLIKDNFFIRTYEYTAPNPFNAFRDLYGYPDKNGTAGPGTLMYIFNNGHTVRTMVKGDDPLYNGDVNEIMGYWVTQEGFTLISTTNPDGIMRYTFEKEIIPSFTAAFPSSDGSSLEYPNLFNPNNLKVYYSIQTSARLKISGNNKHEREYGFFGDHIYIFPAKFDGQSENIITYRFIRPNPYGWYLIAGAAGGIAIGAVFLVIKLRKKKGSDLSGTPYDPYPSEAFGRQSLNPFAGEPNDERDRLN